MVLGFFFFFKQKTAYEMRISDWSSDVCSSDLIGEIMAERAQQQSVAVEPPLGVVEDVVGLEVDEGAAGLVDMLLDHRRGRAEIGVRSEERRVGKECVSTCRSRWSPYH